MTKMLITTYMFPTILLAVPYVTVMAKLGLINTWIGVVITYLSFSIPYAIWMLIGFFQTVPIGIEEAAKVDGVGKFGIFFQIVLPIVSPGIVSTAIYTFINTWNEFLYALLLINNSEKMPLSIALYSLTGSENTGLGTDDGCISNCNPAFSSVLYDYTEQDCRRIIRRVS